MIDSTGRTRGLERKERRQKHLQRADTTPRSLLTAAGERFANANIMYRDREASCYHQDYTLCRNCSELTINFHHQADKETKT